MRSAIKYDGIHRWGWWKKKEKIRVTHDFKFDVLWSGAGVRPRRSEHVDKDWE